MCKQADCFKKMNQGNPPDSQGINNIDDCMSELQRLRNLLKEKDSQLGDLIEDNTCMCDAAIESNKRLTELDKKVRELDRDTRCMEEGMRESINLIEDIGDVAKENEKLKDKVNNMKSSELQQQLDDCLENNKIFKEALKNLGVDPDSLSKGGQKGEHPCDSLDKACNDDTCPDDICQIKREAGQDGERISKKGGLGGDDDIDNLKKQLEDCLQGRKECEELNKAFKDALIENGIDPDNLKAGKGGQGSGAGGQGSGAGGQGEPPGGQGGAPPGGQGGVPDGQGGKGGQSEQCEDLDYSCHDDTCPDNVCPVKKGGGVDDGADGLKDDGGFKVGGDVDGDKGGKGGKGGKGKGDDDKDGKGKRGSTADGQGEDDDGKKGADDDKLNASDDGKKKGASNEDKNKRGKSMTGRTGSAADRPSGADRPSRSGRDSKLGSKSGKAGTSKGKGGGGGKGKGKDGSTEEHFEEFVKNTMKSLNAGEIDGCGLERELRKILDMFIDECGFCFCKCNIPKSRFYAICHKLYHLGLHTLDFKDLAYMHKRIFAAAENILPGCLFNIIMKDILSGSPQGIVPVCAAPGAPTQPSLPAVEQQCCSCKSSLCCNDTDEKLMMKGKSLILKTSEISS